MPKYLLFVKNWVYSGKPGVFIDAGFKVIDNSTFCVQVAGVYYVTANLIVEAKNRNGNLYQRTKTFEGDIHLQGRQGGSNVFH